MSANNWAECPKCRTDSLVDVSKREAALKKLYGKIPVEDYIRKTGELQAERYRMFPDGGTEATSFREDYEIGMSAQGEFTVSYRGCCEKCGLTFTFSHEQQADVK